MAINYNSRNFESHMINVNSTLLNLENAYRRIKIYDHLLDELNSSSNKGELNLNKFRSLSIYSNLLTDSSDYNNVCFVCRKNCFEHLNGEMKDENCNSCEHKKEQHAILQQKFEIKTSKIKVLPDGLENEIDNKSSQVHSAINDFLISEKKACTQLLDEEGKKLFSSLRNLENSSEKEDFFKIIKEALINPRNIILEKKSQAQVTKNETTLIYTIDYEIPDVLQQCCKEANGMVLEIIEKWIRSKLYF
jgi:hypothetical protein